MKHTAKKTILVTGGMGFIGSNFVEALYKAKPESHIVVLDILNYAGRFENIPPNIHSSPRFRFVRGDIRDQGLVEQLMQNVDYVVHFAAESHVTRSLQNSHVFYDVNLMGTHTMIRALLQAGRSIEKFIHISTCEVYGDAYTGPIQETLAQRPATPYAGSKAAAETLVYAFYKSFGIPVVIVRPFNGYGPREHIEKVIPRFITNIIQNKPIEIHGTGKQTRDWTYIDDFSHGLMAILETPIKKVHGEIMNFGSGKGISINDIASIIVDHSGTNRNMITHIADRPGQVYSFEADTAVAQKLIGWNPATKFQDGLKQTIDWYRNNPGWWMPLLGTEKVEVAIDHTKVQF